MSIPAHLRPPLAVRPVDAAVALGLLTVALLTLGGFSGYDGEDRVPRDTFGVALLFAQTLPLIWRQVAPRIVLAVTVAAWAFDVGGGYPDSMAGLSILIAVHAVGAFLPRRQAITAFVVALTITLSWTLVGYFATDNVGVVEIIAIAVGVAVPFAMGRSDASKRERVTDLELKHLEAVQAKHEAAEAAVRTERARIARELHDVVAHEITVMTLQAEGARRAASDGNPALIDALRTISDSGRKGLQEMQRMISVLRDTSESNSNSAPVEQARVGSPHMNADVHGLGPMPSLSSLPNLAKQVIDAGLPVELHITGSAHVPAGVELSAYRIVQESLTNALKHAGPQASATVRVKRARTAVTVVIEDDGRGVISDVPKPEGSGGHGLAGMRERVLALGGSIEFGPRPGGGFRVRAVLPSHDDTVSPKKSDRLSLSLIVDVSQKETT